MSRNYKFSNRSQSIINSTHTVMQRLCQEALFIANARKLHCPDFGISRGRSTTEEQAALYTKGRTNPGAIVTNCDGIKNRSVHQDALAIDFYGYVDGKTDYSDGVIALIATCFMEAASNLRINIDWGGSFKSISDGAHIEVILWDEPN
jgi:peptidoglycan L-alanyl-D-glutamate endopeptidase CwlK